MTESPKPKQSDEARTNIQADNRNLERCGGDPTMTVSILALPNLVKLIENPILKNTQQFFFSKLIGAQIKSLS